MGKQGKKTNFENLFPRGREVHMRVAASAPDFMKCPGGHVLPTRPRGTFRCTPVDCGGGTNVLLAKLPLAMDQETASTAEAARVRAQNEESVELMERVGQRAAREALFPTPALPTPPDAKVLGPEEYVRQRLRDLAPLALAHQEFELLYGTPGVRREVASEILDRAGYTRKPDPHVDTRGPVVILNQVNVTPYDQQKKGGKRVRIAQTVVSQEDLPRGFTHPEVAEVFAERVDAPRAGQPVAALPEAGATPPAGGGDVQRLVRGAGAEAVASEDAPLPD